MRIALLTHKVDHQDGQGRVNYEIVRAALERGDEVTVVAEFCSKDIADHPGGRFVRMRERPLPTQLARNIYFAHKSARWLRQHREEFDIVQANGFVTWEPADIVAVHFVHGAWLRNPFFPFHWRSFSPYQWYQKALTIMNAFFERRTFATAKCLIAVSQATAREVADLGISSRKLHVIYNGVDTEEFRPPSPEVPPERSSFGLPEGVALALFVGDIRTPRKNLEAILTALTRLPGVHLAVAGAVEGSPYPEQARQMGLAGRVHFVGKTSRMPVLMRSADLFLMPSRYESFGMVVVEAMASGLPVVLSSRVGAVELVADVCRVVPDPENTADLADAISDILSDADLRCTMADAGRCRALELQWSRTAASYLALYDDFLTRSGRGTAA